MTIAKFLSIRCKILELIIFCFHEYIIIEIHDAKQQQISKIVKHKDT